MSKVAVVGNLVVVVPLRRGAHEEVRSLLRGGPPFETGGALDRYHAFLADREAILVLEGPGVGSDTCPWQDLSAWRDGPRWERCARSSPSLAESVRSWEHAPDLEGVFFGGEPGPGDSEGGDTL